jgi:hypothetical protein
MLNPILGALLRLVRSGVAVGIPMLIQYLQGSENPALYALAPVLMALGKYLRDTFKWEWLPV